MYEEFFSMKINFMANIKQLPHTVTTVKPVYSGHAI